MEIIEVDQWTSTGNIRELDFDSFTYNDVAGGDSEAIRSIGIGYSKKKLVNSNEYPSKGRVWFRKGPDGKCERYKANYDTSD